MRSTKRILWTTAMIQFTLASAFAAPSTSATRTRRAATPSAEMRAQITPEMPKNVFTGSFEFSVGSDSNANDDLDNTEGSFYQLAPTLKINEGGLFSGKVGGKIKDFNDQKLSNQAKSAVLDAAVSLNADLIGNTKSTTTASIKNSDAHTTGNGDLGKPLRYSEIKVSQKLAWDLGRLKVEAEGSAADRKYSTEQSDGASSDIFNPKLIFRDFTKTEGSAKVAIELSEHVAIAAIPKVSLKQYDNYPGRETNGESTGSALGSPNREYMQTELKAQLPMTFGPVELVPHVVSGLQNDRANGAEDYNFTGIGIETTIIFNKSNNFKIGGGIERNSQKYDNWSYALAEGTRRDENDTTSKVSASVDIMKNLSIALNYENTVEESNLDDPTENYRREVVSTGITMAF